MSRPLDPRVTPARADLAAAGLRGRVAAPRYADGRPHRVVAAVTALRFRPEPTARQESQLLHGEPFTVYHEADGWAWGQAGLDDYVGYVALADLAAGGGEPTHAVRALSTHLYPEPELKAPVLGRLGFGCRIAVHERSGGFCRCDAGWLYSGHLAPADAALPDVVRTANRFLGVPYLWGGRSADGLDCSGLVQLALQAAGRRCPRDSDQQAAALGSAVGDPAAARPGDLVFFPGHVGFLLAEDRFLHANAFDMQVAVHRFGEVRGRAGEIVAIRRLD